MVCIKTEGSERCTQVGDLVLKKGRTTERQSTRWMSRCTPPGTASTTTLWPTGWPLNFENNCYQVRHSHLPPTGAKHTCRQAAGCNAHTNNVEPRSQYQAPLGIT